MKVITGIFVITLIVIVSFSGCKKDDAGTNPTVPTTKTMTLSHWGVDWSEGKAGDPNNQMDPNKIDGETIAWCPNGNGGGWMTGIWFRSREDKIMRVGTGDLLSVTTLDTTKWSNDVCGTALKPGDIWATKAIDGYVIFKVTAVATDSAGIANGPATWPATVEYIHSTTINFK